MKATACDTKSCFLCRSCLPQWGELTALKKKTFQSKRGDVLFQEGAAVTGLYFTLNGAVKIHKHWDGPKELIIRFAGSGDIIGLRGLGGQSVFPVSATVLDPTKACFIPIEHLENSLLANPTFSYNLTHFCAAELTKAEHRMSQLAHADVKGRVVECLLELLKIFGTTEDGFINLTISRQDIAAYAGTTYETIFRIFTEWLGAAMIQTDGKRLKILDVARLAALSNA